jgi:hypothetical protein
MHAMMQPFPLGFGPATNTVPQWFGNETGPGIGTAETATNATAPGDFVSRPWWANAANGNANGVCPDGYGNAASGNAASQLGSGGSLGGLLSGLVGILQQLLGSLTGAADASGAGYGAYGGAGGYGGYGNYGGQGYGAGYGGTGYGAGCGPGAGYGGVGYNGGFPAQNGFTAQQQVGDMTIQSAGDPHLSEKGTLSNWNGTTQQIDQTYDSMTSHADLVDSAHVAGGYKVSTTVTAPGANGVTYNQSATISANRGRDSVTLEGNGSYSILDGGRQLQLAKGNSATLAGGETVTMNDDGSLTVAASNAQGGKISTTMRTTDGYVDVTTHAVDIGLGGDVMQHNAAQTKHTL